MPRYLGKKSKAIAEAAERQRIALDALKTADPDQMSQLAQELADASLAKAQAREEPKDQFDCAWCPPNARVFSGRTRVVFEVTGHDLYNGGEDPIEGQRYRERPLYLVACGICAERRGLVVHLKE